MTTYLFDLGNTRLKFMEMGASRIDAMAHGDADFVARLAAALPPSFDRAVVAFVGPLPVREAMLDLLSQRAEVVVIARTQPELGRLQIAYGEPSHLGVDRFLAMLSVSGDAQATLLVGVGTALTVDFVDATGRHHGGRIAPSPTLMREALAGKSVALPVEGGNWTMGDPFADDTVPALASGCEGAAVALIEASLGAARQLDPATRLLLHGGGAGALMGFLGDAALLPEGAVLRGLAEFIR